VNDHLSHLIFRGVTVYLAPKMQKQIISPCSLQQDKNATGLGKAYHPLQRYRP